MNRKWNLQDIRPVERNPKKAEEGGGERARRDITPRHERKKHTSHEGENEYESIGIVDGRRSKRKRVIIFSVIAIVILSVGFLLSVLMGGADVTVYPKFRDTTVQATFSAFNTPSADQLGYELLTLEEDGERQVAATGKEEVSTRATGDILIYNTHSESPQRLIKNTRFETPEGLIFRIDESIEVPGMTRGESGEIIPGVVTAKVFADGTGEQYNIEPTRFTIPGLEGTAQFDTMYAESNEAFTGGFEGNKFIIDDKELQTAKQELHLELRNALLARVKEERPADFVMYTDAITFVFDSLPSTQHGDELVTIKERARLQVPLFGSSEFASYLAKSTVPGYEGLPVSVAEPESLSFTYTGATTTTSDLAIREEIEFSLSGDTRIIWEYDEKTLKDDLLGLSKTALPSVLSGYPAIKRAEAVIRPFWKQTFPEEPDEISVQKVVGESYGE